MLYIAIAFFSLAAILGMILITYVLQNKNTPKGLAFTHGFMAATGLILLLVYSFYHRPTPIESIVLFILAALGGFFLIYKDLTGQPIPKWVAVAHGLIAVIGFVFLIVFVLYSIAIP